MTEVNEGNNETTVGYRSLKKVIRSFTSTDEVENRATKIDEKKLGRHTVCIIILVMLYAVFGAIMFKKIEQNPHIRITKQRRLKLNKYLENQSRYLTIDEKVTKQDLTKILKFAFDELSVDYGFELGVRSVHLETGEINFQENENTPHFHWGIIEAFFLCLSIMTTVGYGTRTPKTELGKVMVMVYGIIGIVLIGLFVSILTKKFTIVVQKFDDFYKNNPVCYRLGNNFFVSWFLLFNFVQLVVPALVFYGMERDVWVNKTEKSNTENVKQLGQNWSIVDSVYYVFVTLSTIGFGDYLPAKNRLEPASFAEAVVTLSYLVFILVWVLSGLVQLNFVLCVISEIIHQWYVKSEIKIHQGFVADKLKNGLMVGLSSGGGREGQGRSASDKHCFRDGDGNADIVLQKQGDRLSYLNRLSNPIFGRRYGTTRNGGDDCVSDVGL